MSVGDLKQFAAEAKLAVFLGHLTAASSFLFAHHYTHASFTTLLLLIEQVFGSKTNRPPRQKRDL